MNFCDQINRLKPPKKQKESHLSNFHSISLVSSKLQHYPSTSKLQDLQKQNIVLNNTPDEISRLQLPKLGKPKPDKHVSIVQTVSMPSQLSEQDIQTTNVQISKIESPPPVNRLKLPNKRKIMHLSNAIYLSLQSQHSPSSLSSPNSQQQTLINSKTTAPDQINRLKPLREQKIPKKKCVLIPLPSKELPTYTSLSSSSSPPTTCTDHTLDEELDIDLEYKVEVQSEDEGQAPSPLSSSATVAADTNSNSIIMTNVDKCEPEEEEVEESRQSKTPIQIGEEYEGIELRGEYPQFQFSYNHDTDINDLAYQNQDPLELKIGAYEDEYKDEYELNEDVYKLQSEVKRLITDENKDIKKSTDDLRTIRFRGHGVISSIIRNPNGTFACDLCQRSFTLRRYAVHHRWTHKRNKATRCPVCGHDFYVPINMQKHLLNDHRDYEPENRTGISKTWELDKYCRICDHWFFSRLDCMEHHNDIHTVRTELYSEIALVLRTLPIYLRPAERKEKLRLRKHKCNECDKSFKEAFALSKHQKVHHKAQRNPCRICGNGFRYAKDRNKHEWLAHNFRAKYYCNKCGKNFTNAALLVVHEGEHQDPTEKTCSICNRMFLDKKALKRHRTTMHPPVGIVPTLKPISRGRNWNYS